MSTQKELEAGALTDWTTAQQSAHYATHLALQAEKDEQAKEKEKAEADAKARTAAVTKAENVQAGQLVDDLVSVV
jgi:predicted Holliday junction resolvase-like endonuclease